ncbi:unnamed protein product [Acanthoscelides obtectus]|uniref:Uncharacterized protein n=1 Tax=Acanthoscelides obtectus TaxID=200917 RepID=A0A9P0PVW8_ACAOB|nr:unnamed protein product [Acanthoscelides obtectus]CAK1651469.1 hypothetical protein AOBTE_LOCUS17305 [Acanthoscelides obtectus]
MGADERYEPTLWYYHLFHFLGDQETPRKSEANLNETEKEVEAQPTENSIESLDQPIEEDESTTHDDTGCQTTEATQSTPKKAPFPDHLNAKLTNVILCWTQLKATLRNLS